MWDFKKYNNRIAVIGEDGGKFTYGQLNLIQSQFATMYGKRKELVFLQCSNTLTCLAIYVSCICNRRPVLLLDENIHPDRFSILLESYRPVHIFLCRENLEDALQEIYHQNKMFHNCHNGDGYTVWNTQESETPYPIYEELALLLSTSGSTGSEKQVRISYENLENNTRAIVEALHIDENCHGITSLPMSYTYGLSVINTHLYVGGTILLTRKGIYQKGFWEFYHKYNGNSFAGVPYMYRMLKKMNLTRYLFPQTKILTQAGGKLDTDLQRYFGEKAEASECNFFIMYGQTEATARMTVLSSEDVLKKSGSVGKPIPGGKVVLWDEENGCPITKADIQGQILYEGKNVSLGYARGWEDLGKGDENHGYLFTGDYGYLDEEGYLYITGRKDRNVKILGKRVSMDEVEKILEAKFGGKFSCRMGTNLVIQGQSGEQVREFISELLDINRKLIELREN